MHIRSNNCSIPTNAYLFCEKTQKRSKTVRLDGKMLRALSFDIVWCIDSYLIQKSSHTCFPSYNNWCILDHAISQSHHNHKLHLPPTMHSPFLLLAIKKAFDEYYTYSHIFLFCFLCHFCGLNDSYIHVLCLFQYQTWAILDELDEPLVLY